MHTIPESPRNFEALLDTNEENLIWLDKITIRRFKQNDHRFLLRMAFNSLFLWVATGVLISIFLFLCNIHTKDLAPIGIIIAVIIYARTALSQRWLRLIRRRQFSRLIAETKGEEPRLVGGATGIKVSSRGLEWSCPWKYFRDVVHEADRTALVIDEVSALVIPHRCLGSPDDIAVLRAYAEKIKSHASEAPPIS